MSSASKSKETVSDPATNVPGSFSGREERYKAREENSKEIEDPDAEWGHGINPENYSPVQLNQYALWRLSNYKSREHSFERKMHTEDLFNEFWEDFNTFELKHFNMLIRDVTRPLREYLRDHGVWVRNERTVPIALSLFNCTRSDNNVWLDKGYDAPKTSEKQELNTNPVQESEPRAVESSNSTYQQAFVPKCQNPVSSTDHPFGRDIITILINRLDKLQKSLSPEFRTDATLHDKIISACINIEACKMACYRPSPTVPGLIHDLKSGIEIFNKSLPSSSVLLAQSTSQSINQNKFFTDRKYHNWNENNKRLSGNLANKSVRKRCWICKKKGCWSEKHPKSVRDEHRRNFSLKLEKSAERYITDMEGKHDDYESDEIDL
ncbi:hypothetical protein GcM3_187033 [Golovinomyces cichoracearum]|uniref:Uncharacterized protein n=1 Tax=Golovinomyces cichoracearum TaxID=62708 RepID=A0A420HJI3_9PEZI|nr:hypothetical protein GcM3_187033 [Golovinomyces cichoracearum]